MLSGVRLARLVLPAMKRADWGRIVFISSESAVQIPAEMIHYGMTKTAQLAVARGLAESVAGTGITVNSVLPGPTRSRGVGDFVEALAKADGKTPEAFEKDFFAHGRGRPRCCAASSGPRRSPRWSPTSPARWPRAPTARRAAGRRRLHQERVLKHATCRRALSRMP